MRKPRRRFRLQVEGLESRVVLSGAPAQSAALQPSAHLIQRTAAMIQRASNPTVRALYMVAGSNVADAGTTYQLAGRTRILGTPVGMKGLVVLPGFVAQGKATGQITLSTPSGTATLQLDGPTVPGGSKSITGNYNFTVVGTSGTSQPTGSGTLSIQTLPGRSSNYGRAIVQVHLDLNSLAGR